MVSLLTSFDDGKPGTIIEREGLRTAFITARSSHPILTTITDIVDGSAAKTPGTLAKELAGMSKDRLINTARGDIRIVNLRPVDATPLAEAAE